MGYLVLVVMVLFLLCVLWAPATLVLLLVKRLRSRAFAKSIAVLFPVQLVGAISLILLADRIGLLNPAGYILAITVLTGCAGGVAASFWPSTANKALNTDVPKDGAPVS